MGDGETYLWSKVIKHHRTAFVHNTYSYVSLFGLNSLLDVKRAIFENSVPSEKAGILTTKESVIENVKKLEFSDATGWLRKISTFGKEAKIPFVGSFGGLIDSIQYASVKDTVICIDDFERRGNGLSARDVLGLISNLVESKGCSVILILNEGSLRKDDEFFTFSEKVFDYEVMYAPTLDEAAGVVFNSDTEYEKKIVINVKKLKINNIRLLRKVKYFADLIGPYVVGKPDEIVDESTKLIPLAIYAKYSGADKVVDINDLENYKGGFSLVPSDKKELTSEQKVVEEKKFNKNNFFHEYGYGEADELASEIIKLVQNGYADSSSLIPLIDSISVIVEKNKRRKKIADAWNLFHYDLTISDADLLDVFEIAVRESGDATNPYEIDGVFEIFTAAGLEGRGKAIVDEYFNFLEATRFINNRRDLYKQPKNAYVIDKLEQYFELANRALSLEELVEDFHDKSITGEVIESLSAFTVDQFYSYFKSLGSMKFVSYAESLLALASRAGLPYTKNYYEIVFFKVFEALKRMHDESPLMALRMKKFMDYQEVYNHKKLARG